MMASSPGATVALRRSRLEWPMIEVISRAAEHSAALLTLLMMRHEGKEVDGLRSSRRARWTHRGRKTCDMMTREDDRG